MGRRLVLLAVLLVGGLGFGAWVWVSQNETVQQIKDVAREMDLEADVGVDLSLQGVQLTQGEAGSAQWRLTASKARYDQEQGRVEVESPEVTYYLKDNGELKVTAPKGEVRQQAQTAHLWPKVQAHLDDKVITADELYWTGKDQTIILNGTVRLQGPGIEFTTPVLRLRLADNELFAENGVTMVLETGPIEQGAALP